MEKLKLIEQKRKDIESYESYKSDFNIMVYSFGYFPKAWHINQFIAIQKEIDKLEHEILCLISE